MGGVGNLVGHHGAADAGMLRPPGYAGLEKSAGDNQLPAALEQVEQARSAVRPLELVGLLHREPWHPPTLRRQRVTGATTLLLFHEELPARCLPLLPRHYFPQLHRFGFLHGAYLSSFASFASVFLVMARRLGLSGAPLGHARPVAQSTQKCKFRKEEERRRAAGPCQVPSWTISRAVPP